MQRDQSDLVTQKVPGRTLDSWAPDEPAMELELERVGLWTPKCSHPRSYFEGYVPDMKDRHFLERTNIFVCDIACGTAQNQIRTSKQG